MLVLVELSNTLYVDNGNESLRFRRTTLIACANNSPQTSTVHWGLVGVHCYSALVGVQTTCILRKLSSLLLPQGLWETELRSSGLVASMQLALKEVQEHRDHELGLESIQDCLASI